MKETDGWVKVKIKKYTNDEGQPVCGKCIFGPTDNCMLNSWKGLACRWDPGPSCPVWYGESKSEWQEIKTAPKDEEVFIGQFIDGNFKFGKSVCFYEKGNEFEGEY